ncbi:hypothetical protein [Streptomyces sp. NRRL S-920]|uniref:hypothetical protein n=1 Tax=Streptomyces sp. NRRL S-920 TaxID=1463921 RepID=UPI0004C97BC3|nr:hypothetical protein [Streptomyces sp. NRRL S-920]
MKAPALSRRTVAILVGAVLVIAGAVVASIAVFGGSATPDPEPSGPFAVRPSNPVSKQGASPSADPTTQAGCLLYDFECQAEGGSAVVPRHSPPPAGMSRNGALLDGVG